MCVCDMYVMGIIAGMIMLCNDCCCNVFALLLVQTFVYIHDFDAVKL